jgi:hypothetical protein
MRWLDSEAAQEAVNRIDELIAAHPESFFGSYADFLLQAIVVTVEPAEIDPLRWLPELEKAAGSAIGVILRPACRPRAELEAVKDALWARDWYSSPAPITWGAYIDASNSRVVVTLPPEATVEAANLQNRFGALVYVVWGNPIEHAFPDPEIAPPAQATETTTSDATTGVLVTPGSLPPAVSAPADREVPRSGELIELVPLVAIAVLLGLSLIVFLRAKTGRP